MTLKLINFSILMTSINNYLIEGLKKYRLQAMAVIETAVNSIGLLLKKHDQRVKLKYLTDQQLKDIGISRSAAEKEASKIF